MLAHAALNLPFAVFFYCGFLWAVPVEREEAVVLDGCSTPRLFAAVVFPLLCPATASLAVFVVLAVFLALQWHIVAGITAGAGR